MEHPLIFAICAFLMLMVLMSWVGYRLFYLPGRMLKQLGRPVITSEFGGQTATGDMDSQPGTIVTFLQEIGSKVPTSEIEVASLRTLLIRAGFRSEHALSIFYGTRLISTLAMLMLCVMASARMASANASMNVVMIAFGCLVGWILPKMVLERKAKHRQEILRLSLPDALDLLVVSIEAGLGLDMAMQHVGRELQVSHPQLSEELSLVTLEMRAGKRRADALRNLADRTGEGELRKLVAILVQSDRFGTSMGESPADAFRFPAHPPPAGSRGTSRQGGREAGISDFLLHPAIDADRGGGTGTLAGLQVSLPDDEEHSHVRKGDKTMSSTLIQTLIWLFAGGVLLVFLKRRRSRRTQH